MCLYHSTYGLVHGLVEAEQVADDAAVQKGAIGVGVGEERGMVFDLPRLFEMGFL